VRRRPEPSTPAWLALAALLVVVTPFLLHETRGTTFWFDEWEWVLGRRGWDAGTFLEPHNDHLSLVPVAIYKLLFETAGLTDYAPYRVIVTAGHLLCVVLVFVYAGRRIGSVAALLPAALILLLGPGWQNFLWPFQIAWLIALAAGVGALLMLDRGDRRGDAAACALLALAVLSSGLGVVIAAGVIVELVWGRRDWRPAWIAAAPLALYAVWWLGYHDTGFVRHNVVLAPGFAADAAGAALSGLAGLYQTPPTGGSETTLGWGRPLAVAAAAVVVWRLAALRPVPPRALALLTILVGFWLLTGVQRAQFGLPDSSRYVYVGALFLLLLAVELMRGVAVSRGVALLVAGAAALVIVANVGDLRDGGRYLRAQAPPTRASLGAIEIGGPAVPAGFVASGLPGFPFVIVEAGEYRDAVRELGSPAASPAEIAAAPEDARRVADAELVRIHDVAPRPGAARPARGDPPVVDDVRGGRVVAAGGCVRFRPAGAGPADAAPELQLTLPAAGLLLDAQQGTAMIAVRRFAAGFPEQPHGHVDAAGTATLRIPPDRSPQPWHVRVAPEARFAACALR
jgi:hypothetical protein